jgi:hypothetical protein
MSDLYVPAGLNTSNLHLNPEHTRASVVTSDMYNICDRLREISPRLYLLELTQQTAEGEKFGYALMEHCIDGVDRLVFRVTRDGLDGRVLAKVRYAMGLDLHERIAYCDRERDAEEAHQREAAAEELYERMGGPMWTEMERTGFIQRPVSYAKGGATHRRHKNHKRARHLPRAG